MNFETFYAAAATAAATLLGLLFLAVQFNLDRMHADVSRRWLVTARSTFLLFVVLFLLPLIYLLPATHFAQAIAAGAVLAFYAYRIVEGWLPMWQAFRGHTSVRVIHALWLLAGPLAVVALLMVYAVQYAQGVSDAQVGIGFSLIGLFALTLRNVWDLLVEIRTAG